MLCIFMDKIIKAKKQLLSVASFLLIVFPNLGFSSSISEINIDNTSLKLSYSTAPRLSQVIVDATNQLNYKPYYFGASLLNENSLKAQDIIEKKEFVINLLEIERSKTTKNLINILDPIQFHYKEKVTLDLEEIQINPKKDPLINGRYRLSLPTRFKYIYLIDPYNQNTLIKLAIKEGYDLKAYLKHYLTEYSLTNASDKSKSVENFTIIQADKSIVEAKINHRSSYRYYLSPGSIVYLKLDKALASYEAINDQVINLLTQHLEF